MKNFITITLLFLSLLGFSQTKTIINKNYTYVVDSAGKIEKVDSTVTSTKVLPTVITLPAVHDTIIKTVTKDTCLPAVTPNKPPVSDAGSDKTITLPVNTVTLVGSGSDADGKIAGYVWTKISGPSTFSISGNTSATATLSNLVQGIYTFRLTVIDDDGDTGSDDLNIVVNAAAVPPVSYGTLIYSNGFNSISDIDPYGNGQWGTDAKANHLSTTVYKDGPGSFKSAPTGTVSAGYRSEVQFPSSLTPTEGVIEYDVMYITIVPNDNHTAQFHPNTSGGSAAPGLWTVGGKFMWRNWTTDGKNTDHPTNITIETNVWYHMRLEYKFGSNGYFKNFSKKDGQSEVLICSWTGQVGDGSGQFFKLGYNGGWGTSKNTSGSFLAYYDNLKIWKK